ncbi:MAG: SDR family NAD(P)-dependent oxidoreductase [Bacteroidota bacterium]
MQNIDLEGQIALVTGGSGGIGRNICTSLAKAGATVAVGFHTNMAGAQLVSSECGNNSAIFQGDLGNPEDCRKVIDSVIACYGRIDLLVNNAAISSKDGVHMNYVEWVKHWQQTLNGNLLSAVHMSYWTILQMMKQKRGKIINIASRSAFRGETEYMAYAVSKAGMVNLTRCLARTHAGDGIQVYSVAPGFIEAGMGLSGIAEHGDEIRSQIPSGKIGSPDDVANVVMFLASPLSNYMTGSTIDINGGSYLH